MIHVVAVNLYPFQETVAKGACLAEAVEQIDIGGPTMVRAAAKNFERVTVIVNPAQYGPVLDELREGGEVPQDLRRRLAWEAFSHTARYDQAIAAYLGEEELLALEDAERFKTCAMGRTPRNEQPLPSRREPRTLLAASSSRKELSYNNWMDSDAAGGSSGV